MTKPLAPRTFLFHSPVVGSQADGRPRSVRGFTLIEMMIALAISALTIAVASSVAVSIGKTVSKTTKGVEADSEAKMLTEYLGAQMHGVGGATLRPWGSVRVINGPGGAPDELIITELDDDLNLDCGIAEHPGTSIAGNVKMTTTLDEDDSGSNPDEICCFEGLSLAGREVVITDEDGVHWEQARIASASESNCRINFSNSVANPTNRSFGAGNTIDFDNGSVLLVNTRRFWLDGNEQLKVDETLSDGVTTEVLLADRVRDFQASLGYDVNPRDGRVVSSNSTADEWLFNAPGDALNTGGLTGALIQDLRRVAVGVVVYVPVQEGGVTSDAQILDGLSHSSTTEFYRGAVAYLTFRNSFIFQ